MHSCRSAILSLIVAFLPALASGAEDFVRDLQTTATETHHATWGHWGTNPEKYSDWTTHSNRLIPVYTFGISLDCCRGEQSPYRSKAKLRDLYGCVPEGTLNPEAEYFDQTDIYRLQLAALAAGKKYVILLIFDGTDWQTTQAAAIYQSGRVPYREGRGTGLLLQDYRGTTTDFGYFVCSPHNDGTKVDVDRQAVLNPGGTTPGGYDFKRAGSYPWSEPAEPLYLISKSHERKQAYTDSSSSATSLMAGIKTYNNGVNVDYQGKQAIPLGQSLQKEGYGVGVVTSVPISHATPASAYAANVHRDDYQDLSRDLVGLASISHPNEPLPGVDVLLGGGWGETAKEDKAQGENFVPGNRYLADPDLAAVDQAHGGKYVVAQRAAGRSGKEVLEGSVRQAVEHHQRLLGFFGTKLGHLPFRTADGNFDPTLGPTAKAEAYSPDDLRENPNLADLSAAALAVLETHPKGFWLMIEAGDVDWANHANNIDNSIGAVISGDLAFATVVNWVERRNAWNETAVIVTADHGHAFFLRQPEMLAHPAKGTAANAR